MARMQAAMDRFLAAEWPKRAPGLLVRTPHEALALASIVEKETAVASERATVAAVYYNRLRTGMRLQADPTIIYPITGASRWAAASANPKCAPSTATTPMP